jgi:murein DD-endopeptidase MepM/ murein hydrolase activator NlpD
MIVTKVPAVEESEEIVSNDELIETDEAPPNLALRKPVLDLDDEVPAVKPIPQQTSGLDAAPVMGGMRWPVKGKIISEYGAKPNGLKNEGINIAVPEGTGVRAAESGVVAYAGNELKGYGNLVLIRHEGGWVTAYAHAKELFVKRGDIVRRGEVIAKAGQTGSVSSPQLHFEVRKGATAMDPLKFLASTTASN